MGAARRYMTVLVSAGLLIAALTSVALAGGKGGGRNTDATLTLVLMDGATEPQHGGRITFEVSAPRVDQPFVGLRCWQGSDFVYDAYVGYYAGYWFDQWFLLDSDYWADGIPASCTARLFWFDRQGRERLLTTLDVPVAP